MNLLARLLRTKASFVEVQKEIETMKPTNWKTNTLGVLTLTIGLMQIWSPPSYLAKVNATASLFAGLGLIVAKDHDK